MSKWEAQRARFNHDQLKNQFIQSVVRLVRVLQGQIVDRDFIENFVGNLLSRWGELKTEALELLDRTEKQSVPTTWFQEDPLSRLNPDDRRWMEALLTDELLSRFDVSEAIKRAYTLVYDVDEKCRAIVETFWKMHQGCDSDRPKDGGLWQTADGALLQRAIELYHSCQTLSNGLQSLAHTDDAIIILTRVDQSRCA